MYDVYVSEKGREEYILNPNGDPMVATSDAGLMDLISTFFMDGEYNISRTTPQYMGHDVDIKVYPQYKSGGLAMNKKTFQIRRIKTVGVHRLYLFNTDDKYKADMQRNGYAMSRPVEVRKDDWMPLEDGECNIYYPGSSIGKDPDYDKMEYDGMMTL